MQSKFKRDRFIAYKAITLNDKLLTEIILRKKKPQTWDSVHESNIEQ